MKTPKLLSTGLVAFFAVQSTSVLAQANTLDEMVISANFTPTSVAKIGSAVTVIDAKTIRESKASHVVDLLKLVPGINISRTSNKGSLTAVRMRGAESNHVLVRIDGVEVNSSATGGAAFLSAILVNDIERIEVVRGPQSALTGSDALAGTINIYTHSGQGAEETQLGMELGSDSTQQITLQTLGHSDSSHYKMAIQADKSDGYSTASAGTEDDGYDNTNAAFAFGEQLSDTAKLDATVRFSESDLDVDGTDFTSTSPTFGQTIDNANTQEDRSSLVQLSLKQKLSGFDSTVNLSQADIENKFLSAAFGSSTSRGKKTKLSWQGDWVLGESNGLSTLLEAEKNDYNQTGATASDLSNQSQQTTDYAAALEYRFDSQDGWFGSASIRHDANDAFDDSTTFRLTGAHLIGNGKAHASIGSGVTNPTFVETFGFFPGSFIGNPALQPEESLGFDIGYEHRFANDAVVFDITYFEADLENEIRTVFNPDFTSTVVNLDKDSERKGIELSLSAALGQNTTLSAAYTKMESEDGDGNPEIRRPEKVASLSLTHKSMGDRLTTRIDATHSASSLDTDFANGVDVILGSYTLVDANVDYRLNETLSLYTRVENAFDEEYENVFGFSTAGTKWFVGFNARF